MFVEIERKFLINNNSYKIVSYKSKVIKQGFLNTDKNRVVRVRISGDKGFITVKGVASEKGASRFEWEKEISHIEAQSLLNLCENNIVEKIRYFVKNGVHTIEVDEFKGNNKGLVIAEIELNTVDEKFGKPNWIGQEVTGISKYYNSELSKNPYKYWK